MKNAKQYIEKIVLEGSPAEKMELYGFDNTTSEGLLLKKFKIFCRGNYPRFFHCKSAEFHDDMIRHMIKSYYGLNLLNIAGRGLAKTTIAKLFITFVLLNDRDQHRRYIKILTKDFKNSKQIVTDVYNLTVEVREIYGDVFEKEGDLKREETMGSFTMKDGRKLASGTVGQTQRGHIQDAYRPDWLIGDDLEDRDSVKSSTVTQGIIDRWEEAVTGLSRGGSYMVLSNYISDQGTTQHIMDKPSVETKIYPLADLDLNPFWPERDTKKDIEKIKGDADDFWGEYMCDPERSVNKFFDTERIEDDMKKATPPTRKAAGVNYWAKYQPNHRYGQGSDHSEGVGLDSNTLAGFDFTTGELIYTYANNTISPDLAAHEFARVGSEFGNCIYGFEVNHECGGTVRATLKQLDYPNLYKQVKEEKMQTIQTENVGWKTTSVTKRNMFMEFRTDYNDGLIKIHDVEVLKEMKAYSNSDLSEKTVGLITRHFDLLMAVMIAWQMRDLAVIKKKKAAYGASVDKFLEETSDY